MRRNRIAGRVLAYGKCRDPLFSLLLDIGQHAQDNTKPGCAAGTPAAPAEQCGRLDTSGGFIRRPADSEILFSHRPRGASNPKPSLRRDSLQPTTS